MDNNESPTNPIGELPTSIAIDNAVMNEQEVEDAINAITSGAPKIAEPKETEVNEQDQLSEEVAVEEEEPTGNEADGDPEVTEAEDSNPEEEETDPTEETNPDADEYDLSDIEDDAAFVIGGKKYTKAQLSSILGQEQAAGTKARKAAEELKKVEEAKQKLQEQEAWLKQRTNAASQSDQLAEMAAEARKINAKIEKARSEQDMYEVAVQKDNLDVLKGKYAKAQQEVQHVHAQAEAKQIAAAEEGLKSRGLGHLLEDGKEAKAWQDYAGSKLSDAELRAVTLIPALAEALEKARKFDASQKISSKKLTPSKKRIGSTGNQILSKTQKDKAAKQQRVAAGVMTETDIDAEIARITGAGRK